MEDFVAYDSRWFSASLLLGDAAIFLTGLWALGIFGTPPHLVGHTDREIFVVGWCFVLFSGFCGLAIIKSFLDPSEQLRIGQHGVRVANWSEDTIPWSEITRVTTFRGNKQRLIVLHLRNPDRFPGRRWAALIAGANRPFTGGDISFRLDGTDRSFADAISSIQRFKPVG